MESLDKGSFAATNPDLPSLMVQGRTRAETMELAQANAHILMVALAALVPSAAHRFRPNLTAAQ